MSTYFWSTLLLGPGSQLLTLELRLWLNDNHPSLAFFCGQFFFAHSVDVVNACSVLSSIQLGLITVNSISNVYVNSVSLIMQSFKFLSPEFLPFHLQCNLLIQSFSISNFYLSYFLFFRYFIFPLIDFSTI